MIFETFTLKKDSWHVKLMQYIWEWDHTDFTNMCPYFWISVCNIFIVPFVFIFKVGKTVVFYFNALLESKKRRYIEREIEYFKRLSKNHNDATFADYNKLLQLLSPTNGYSKEFVQALIDDGWFNTKSIRRAGRMGYFPEQLLISLKSTPFLSKFKEFIKEMEDRKQSELKPTDLCKYYRPIGITIVAIGTLIIVYYMILGVLYVIPKLDFKIMLTVVGVIALTIIVVMICYCLFYIILEFFRLKFPNTLSSTKTEQVIDSYFFEPIQCIFDGIKKFFQILHQLYKNNCPGIDWK